MAIPYTIILLLVLLGVIALTVFATSTVEGFNEVDTMQMGLNRLINRGMKRYNLLSDAMDDTKNGLLSPGKGEMTINSELSSALQTGTMMPNFNNTTASELISLETKARHFPADSWVKRQIDLCESIKGAGDACKLLDDPKYRHCAVCLKDGRNHRGEPHTGGVFLFKEDRERQDAEQSTLPMIERDYKPTSGKCPPGYLLTLSDTRVRKDGVEQTVRPSEKCNLRWDQIQCELGMRPVSSATGCAQCYNDNSSLMYNGPKNRTFSMEFIYTGPGRISVGGMASGGSRTSLQSNLKLLLNGVRENQEIDIRIETAADMFDSNSLRFAALLRSPTNINRTIPIFDSLTSKHFFAISGTVKNEQWLSLSKDRNWIDEHFAGSTPLIRNRQMRSDGGTSGFSIIIPGFLGEPEYDDDKDKCPTGPILGTPMSMGSMGTNPCFKPGGQFDPNMECVRDLYDSAGCTMSGTMYPNNKENYDLIVNETKKSAGGSLTIDSMVDWIQNIAQIGRFGVDLMGKSYDLETVNDASMKCYGRTIKSPCQIGDPKRPSGACLQHLYNDMGTNGPEGPTYTLDRSKYNQICTTDGTMSPFGKNGVANQLSIAEALRAAANDGIEGVKRLYNRVHIRSNGQSGGTSTEITDALRQCYGVRLDNQGSVSTDCRDRILATYEWSGSNTRLDRIVIRNKMREGPMSDCSLVFRYPRNGTIVAQTGQTLQITNAATFWSLPTTSMQFQARGMRTISFWAKMETARGYNGYLMDLRAFAADSFFWLAGNGAWVQNNCVIYVDGNPDYNWQKSLNKKWHHYAIVFNAPVTGKVALFSRFSLSEGMNGTFGHITVYSVDAKPSEILQMFVDRPTWATDPSVDGYDYMGCFNDTGLRALPVFMNNVGSAEQCKDRAKEQGLNTFGLQNFGECWGGSFPSDNYARHGERQGCPPMGSDWNNQVYYNPKIPTPPVRNVVVFQHCSYQGTSVSIAPGIYPWPWINNTPIKNDQASSARIPRGMRLIIYFDDIGSRCEVFENQDVSCFVDHGCNDVMSACIVEQIARPITKSVSRSGKTWLVRI